MLHILLAEPHATTRRLFAESLNSSGEFLAEETAALTQAWALLESAWKKENPFALLISDIDVQDADKLALLNKIRHDSRFEKLPVILLSGDNEHKSVVAALKAGADAYLIKPVSPATLLEKIREILRQHDNE